MVEGDLAAVEAYKSSGSDIARQLTADEVRLLNRPSAFDDGFTLVHLAIRFQRQDMLAILLTEVCTTHTHTHRQCSADQARDGRFSECLNVCRCAFECNCVVCRQACMQCLGAVCRVCVRGYYSDDGCRGVPILGNEGQGRGKEFHNALADSTPTCYSHR